MTLPKIGDFSLDDCQSRLDRLETRVEATEELAYGPISDTFLSNPVEIVIPMGDQMSPFSWCAEAHTVIVV